MDYKYILGQLERISEYSTTLQPNGYNPAWNVAIMLHEIHKLIQIIQDEANKEQESK